MKNLMRLHSGTLLGVVLLSLAGMAGVAVDFSKVVGPVKPVNGVGQPPILGYSDTSMFHYLKEAGIPYARLHDVGGAYGKNVFVDIPNVFRDFDADENDPKNYDFPYTDCLLKGLVDNGVEPYYRLGVTIENAAGAGMPAYRIFPPRDYAKWARICEHVIRHYTEGWANGFHMKITHWEIWNEPENMETIEKNQMWKAPFSEYVKLYVVAAKHLKSKFPHLKIGGYASCGFYAVASGWGRPDDPRCKFLKDSFLEFLAAVKREQAPLDFFSFHCYDKPKFGVRQFDYVRRTLDEYGFTKTETSCNEWHPSGKQGTAAQAADIAAMLVALQAGPVDDAEIYDARCQLPSIYSPLFNAATMGPYKAYYVYRAFNELRRLGKSVAVSGSAEAQNGEGLWVTAATDGHGRTAALIVNSSAKPIAYPNLFGGAPVRVRAIDETHSFEDVSAPSEVGAHTVLLVEGAASVTAKQ